MIDVALEWFMPQRAGLSRTELHHQESKQLFSGLIADRNKQGDSVIVLIDIIVKWENLDYKNKTIAERNLI